MSAPHRASSAWVLLALLALAEPPRAAVDIEAEASRSDGDRVWHQLEADARFGAWRWRLRQRRRSAAGEVAVTVQGPGVGWLERWVAGDVGIDVGRGVEGWPLGAMRRRPAVRPQLGAALRGAGVELEIARWRLALAAGRVRRGALIAHRLAVAAVAGEFELEPLRHRRGVAGTTRKSNPRVRWSAWTAWAARRDPHDPRVAAGASLTLVTPAHELRADVARTAATVGFDVSARSVSVLGESRIRMTLDEDQPRVAAIAQAAAGAGEASPSAVAPGTGRRLELRQRSGWRRFGVELSAAVRQRSAPGSVLAATLQRSLAGRGSRLELRVRWEDEAWALAALAVADRARLGWARAGDGGAAWIGRLAWRPKASLWVEIEARGWRGGGGRRAATILGVTRVGAGRSLAASGWAGAIGTLRLSWQLRAVRVRLAVAKRQVPEPLSRSVVSAEIRWSLD